jgi:hypothetical protein
VIVFKAMASSTAGLFKKDWGFKGSPVREHSVQWDWAGDAWGSLSASEATECFYSHDSHFTAVKPPKMLPFLSRAVPEWARVHRTVHDSRAPIGGT